MLFKKKHIIDWIAILDLGSPYSQLIAKRVRELNIYAKILPYNFSFKEFENNKPKGIILTGSSSSTIDNKTIFSEQKLLSLNIPILGIDYGMHLLVKMLGGKVIPSEKIEFKNININILQKEKDSLFYKVPVRIKAGVDKKYIIKENVPSFIVTAIDEDNTAVALQDEREKIYGVLFHPEDANTDYGKVILYNFTHLICQCSPEWTEEFFIEDSVYDIREEVRDGNVVAGVSGGIDSLVASLLTFRAIREQLYCIFINTGLMRKEEEKEIINIFKYFNMNLAIYDYTEKFIKSLSGIIDPEEKRRVIGNLFVNIFEEKAKHIGKTTHLLQGTLYSDVIESSIDLGPAAKIKSHHNVAGLPEKMNLKLLEPLRFLFKDEVRRIGKSLGLPEEIIWRQPFPGPGLAIRIAGEVTGEKLSILREADDIIRKEIEKQGWNRKLWQYFGILLPVKSVGVTDGLRTYENTLVLRMVSSEDGMTADCGKIPHSLLKILSNRITKEVHGINRVLYDISSKPPATIEWE